MRSLVFTIGLTVLGGAAWAQGTRSDYERAARLPELTRNKVVSAKVEPHWFGADTKKFWYRRELPEGARQFISVDAEQGTRQPAFDHEQLAAALSRKLEKKFDPKRLPLELLEFADDGTSIRFNIDRHGYRLELASGELSDSDLLKPSEARPQDRNRRNPRGRPRGDESPDGLKSAFIRNHNVVLRLKDSGAELPLCTDGTADDPYESGVFWSPDSTKLVVLKTRKAETHTVYLIESSPKDQVQPKLHSFDYLKPGDRIAHPRVCLFEVPSTNEVASASSPANIPALVRDDLFPNPWSIDEIRWSDDSSRFTFAYNQRGHQVLRIIAVDAKTREATPIVDEVSKTFIDYAGKRYVDYLDDTSEIIWMSERSGWNHLYLYDARTGEVKNPITQGNWVVRGVDRVDHQKRQVWFRAGGVYPEQDPYYVHFGRINLDGSGLTWLTAGDGTHTVEYSPNRAWIIDTWSRVDQPPTIELRKVADGSPVCNLERANWSELLATGWIGPERFTAKGRDGTTDIYGVIWRPTKFDATKTYPVIEHIYAGRTARSRPSRFHHIIRLSRWPNSDSSSSNWTHGNIASIQGVSRRLLEEPG
jgi:dipeptidyl aminopeptidase/acylaminoacyl peptidase